ncbi:MAG: sterol desaturase family protein [Hyphomicrobiales bacterium]
MDFIETEFGAYSDTFQVLEIIGLIFLVAIISETVWDTLTGDRKRFGETFANFAIAVGNALLERTAYGLVFVVGLILALPLAMFDMPATWWSWVLALLMADFTYYWMHRWEHEVRILWAHHSVHHSSPEYNLTTALRLAWVEALVEWLFFVPMILLGFSVVQTIIAILIVVSYQTWIHTEKIGKLGWLDKVFNTPSVHRVHHGSNAQYIDKNYGGILILWDRMFGTYEPEKERVVYGITKPIGSANPLVINFHEYGQIFKDVRSAGSFKNAMGYLLRRPGWKPKGTNTSDS